METVERTVNPIQPPIEDELNYLQKIDFDTYLKYKRGLIDIEDYKLIAQSIKNQKTILLQMES